MMRLRNFIEKGEKKEYKEELKVSFKSKKENGTKHQYKREFNLLIFNLGNTCTTSKIW